VLGFERDDPDVNHLLYGHARAVGTWVDFDGVTYRTPRDSSDTLPGVMNRLEALHIFYVLVDWRIRPPSALDNPLHGPEIARLHKGSPLIVDLIGQGGVAAAVVYLFNNPEKIGAFFPLILQGWRDASVAARRAKLAALELHAQNAELELINSNGNTIPIHYLPDPTEATTVEE
jgi:hypothetical protein